MKLKVDIGPDICAVNTDDLQDFPFPVDIKEDKSSRRIWSRNHQEHWSHKPISCIQRQINQYKT